MKRFYREWIKIEGLEKFQVRVEQSDLMILAEKRLEKEALDLLLQARSQLEGYIQQNNAFLTSLVPLPPDPFAPPIVREMMEAAVAFQVGPMAAVAGAIAEFVAKGLLPYSRQVIVENGGDIYAEMNRPLRVGLLPWLEGRSSQIKIEIPKACMPVSICSSSSKIGHSISFGDADLACIVARSGSMADAAATLAGNLLKKGADINSLIEKFKGHPAILGGVFVYAGKIAFWGGLRIVGG